MTQCQSEYSTKRAKADISENHFIDQCYLRLAHCTNSPTPSLSRKYSSSPANATISDGYLKLLYSVH